MISDEQSTLYAFVFRGLLTEDALDVAGRKNTTRFDDDLAEMVRLVGLDSLDEEAVRRAQVMSVVYTAIAAFENSVRQLISSTLLEELGEDWWEEATSKKIRDAAQSRKNEEEKVRWHTPRGVDPIHYTMLPNLLNIIRSKFDVFEPYLHDIDWVASVFDVIERSRNVIMHSGELTKRDVARLGSTLRDWSVQVAT